MADRQTCNQLFLLKLKALETINKSVPKSPPHIFFVLTNLDCFHLGTSLKKLCLSHVAYIGHLPRALYLFDRQTDRLTDSQVGRHTYSAYLTSQTSYHCLSMDCLKTVSELYMYICVSLPINEPYQTLVSLRQSVFCTGIITLHFLRGGGGGRVVPYIAHSFGCEASDWLRGIWPPCKGFCT